MSWVCGIKYSRPGRTSRTELTMPEICLMLSMIILFSLQKMILLCFPIISITSVFSHRSPISFRCSMRMRMMRSKPGCVISRILAFCKCFLSSIQKPGAVIGLGLFLSVKYMSGSEASADNNSRYWVPLFLIVNSSSSDSGCAIL